MNIDIGDVVKLQVSDDVYEVTGVIHDHQKVYFYQSETEVFAKFEDIETLYKPVNDDS